MLIQGYEHGTRTGISRGNPAPQVVFVRWYNLGMIDETTEIHARAGGDKPIRDLVDAFYVGVESDPVLRPMYPDDLVAARDHLALFLIQRFGGPTTYSAERGHPRLRMRHIPFKIGEPEKEAWLRNMNAAIDSVPELAPFRAVLVRYFEDSAAFLVNHP
jgi:hemoglobin